MLIYFWEASPVPYSDVIYFEGGGGGVNVGHSLSPPVILFLLRACILWNIILDGLNYPPLPAQQVWLNTNLGQPILFRDTQRDDSSKPLKHSIVKRILVFKW